jgi:hypothetical protein
MNQTIKIQHKTLGVITEETFVDPIQFKIFLQTVHGCLSSSSDLDFFNGNTFLLHIPYEVLKESVVTTKLAPQTLTEKFTNKSLIES